MKKCQLIVTLLLVITFFNTKAQTDIEKQFQSLQLNSSPAYVILGVEPENIQRLNSPTDFIANVQSATVNGSLQPNFAIETSPYYWSHPKDNSDKFNALNYVSNNNYWQNIKKSITLSFATSPSDTFTFGNIPKGTGLGIGMHLQLVHGSLSNKVRDNLLIWFYNSRIQTLLNSIIQNLEGDESNEIEDLEGWLEDRLEEGSLKALSATQKEITKNLIKSKVKKLSLVQEDLTSLRRIRSQIERKSKKAVGLVNTYQFPLTREGFMLELAFVNAKIAAENNWDKLTDAKTGVWVTPSYRFNANNDPSVIDFIDIMAVGRMVFNSEKVDSSDYVDIGGKLQWIHEKLSISAEGIYRYLTDKPEGQEKKYTYRTGFTLSYKLNELVTFKTTLGSNFDGNSTRYTEPSKMFIIGGFSFGFSSFLQANSGND